MAAVSVIFKLLNSAGAILEWLANPQKFLETDDMSRRDKLEALLQAEPDDEFLLYALAKEYAAEGNPSAAISRFALLAAQHPDYVPTYLQWAQLLVEGGDAAEGRRVLTRGIEIARRAGDDHAAGEMHELLSQLN